MQDVTQLLTQSIEFIKGTVDSIKLYLFDHPVEVLIIICILIAIILLFHYLPKILAALYKDLIQMFKILMRWAVFGVVIIACIWIIASFSTTCVLINKHLGTDLNCEKRK